MKLITRTSLVTLVNGVTINNNPSYRVIRNSIFIDDKMISDKTDTSSLLGYVSITRAEGIEHGSVSVEQQALLGRQSATGKIGNEVRDKSKSEMPRRKGTKGCWSKEENRKLW